MHQQLQLNPQGAATRGCSGGDQTVYKTPRNTGTRCARVCRRRHIPIHPARPPLQLAASNLRRLPVPRHMKLQETARVVKAAVSVNAAVSLQPQLLLVRLLQLLLVRLLLLLLTSLPLLLLLPPLPLPLQAALHRPLLLSCNAFVKLETKRIKRQRRCKAGTKTFAI